MPFSAAANGRRYGSAHSMTGSFYSDRANWISRNLRTAPLESDQRGRIRVVVMRSVSRLAASLFARSQNATLCQSDTSGLLQPTARCTVEVCSLLGSTVMSFKEAVMPERKTIERAMEDK